MTKHKTQNQYVREQSERAEFWEKNAYKIWRETTRNILRQISNAGGVATRPPRKRLSLSGGLSRSLIGEWPTPDWYKPCPALKHARPSSANC